jgi:hypothetical protein
MERKLTVADLKFPDPEREGIVKNGVREMFGVASMKMPGEDTLVRSVYDKAGRAISTYGYMTWQKVYRYDSTGLPDSLYEKVRDVSAGYRIIPTFDDDAMVLYLYYFDPHYKADRYIEKLTFDEGGRLVQLDRHYLHHTQFKDLPAFKALNNKPEYSARYFYDDDDRLVRDSSYDDNQAVHRYYYSDHLDSMTYRWTSLHLSERETTYYDALSLRTRTKVLRENDSRQYGYTIDYSYRKW